jgi:hypothetical protein
VSWLRRNIIGTCRVSGYSAISSIRQSSPWWRETVLRFILEKPTRALASPNSGRRGRGLGLDAYIWVNDLDPLHAELKERGAKIVEAPGLRV